MTQGRRPRRRDAARHLLHPHQFRDSAAFNRKGYTRNSAVAGAVAALTVLIALPLVYYVSPWPHLVGFASLGALVALFGRFEVKQTRRLRVFQCGLLQLFAVGVISVAAWLGVSLEGQLALLALMCGVLSLLALKIRVGPPGPLIFIFAASASVSANGLSLHQMGERLAAVAVVAALAWGLGALTDGLRHEPSETRLYPADPVLSLKRLVIIAARCAVGAGLAIILSRAIGGAYPAWAAMGAMAVMLGLRLDLVMNRAVQRTVGTLIGALLAWALLSLSPDVLVVILVLAFLQTATEMVIGFNYGLGQIFVTPMALLMTWLGAGQTLGPEIASERVVETCIGAAVGVVIALILSGIEDRRQLAQMRGR